MNLKRTGEFIANLRKEKKWTQEELAEKMIVDRGTISKWERGVYLPNTEMLLKIEEIFKVSINEILYGERKDKKNELDIENVPISLIEDNKKRIRKITLLSLISILSLLILFFVYYFVDNYNSINIYRVTGSKNGYLIDSGIAVVSKEKTHFKLGRISNETEDNKKIVKTRLYYKKGNEEKLIYEGGQDATEYLYINKYGDDELFNHRDIDYFVKNLFLELILDNNEKIIMPLKLEKDYSNDNLINKYINTSPTERNALTDEIEIPQYIKDYFKYDDETSTYTYKDGNITQEFHPDVLMFILYIKDTEITQRFEYSIELNTISYYNYTNSELNNSFVYNLDKNECFFGNCNKSKIEYFEKKYLEKIFKSKE